jgi:hypothetical protein
VDYLICTVGFPGVPAQIIYMVIGSIVVGKMTTFHAIRARTSECLKDQAMHRKCADRTVSQGYFPVPVSVCFLFPQAALARSSRPISSIKTTNATVIADLVNALITHDRLPALAHCATGNKNGPTGFLPSGRRAGTDAWGLIRRWTDLLDAEGDCVSRARNWKGLEKDLRFP